MKRENLYEAEVYLDKEEGQYVIDLRLSPTAVDILSEAREDHSFIYRQNLNSRWFHTDGEWDGEIETYFCTRGYENGRGRRAVPLPRVSPVLDDSEMNRTTTNEEDMEDDDCVYSPHPNAAPRFEPPNPGRDRALKEIIGVELMRKQKVDRRSPTRRILIGPRYRTIVVDQLLRGFMRMFKRKAASRHITYKLIGAVEVEEDD